MQKIEGLDGLRCLAVFAVISTHVGAYKAFADAGIARWHNLVSGTTGVQLFYVLSGFLITTLGVRELRQTGKFDIKRFFLKRFLRIFPLYYLALAAYLAIHLSGYQFLNKTSFAYALIYLYNFIPVSAYQGWLGSFHSLATEEHFYLVFPFLLVALYRQSDLVFGIVLAGYVALALSVRPMFDGYSVNFVEGTYRWTPFACIPILAGCILACLREGRPYQALQSAAVSTPWIRTCWQAFLLLGFSLVFFSQAFWSIDFVFSISFVFLIAYVCDFPDSSVTRFLSLRWIDYFGRISYGLYVWQSFILATGPAEALIRNVPLAVAVVFGLAILSYQFFESPLLRIKERLTRTRTAPA